MHCIYSAPGIKRKVWHAIAAQSQRTLSMARACSIPSRAPSTEMKHRLLNLVKQSTYVFRAEIPPPLPSARCVSGTHFRRGKQIENSFHTDIKTSPPKGSPEEKPQGCALQPTIRNRRHSRASARVLLRHREAPASPARNPNTYLRLKSGPDPRPPKPHAVLPRKPAPGMRSTEKRRPNRINIR